MKCYYRNILIALLMACLKIVLVIANVSDFDAASYLINYLGLGNPYFLPGYMFELLTDLFPILIIQFMEGISIYSHFCTGSDYYFSRQKYRKRWFIEEIIKMCLRIGCYFICYFSISLIIPCIWFGYSIHMEDMIIIFYLNLYFILYSILIGILMNTISILVGSQIGLTIMYSVQILSISMLLLFEKMISLDGAGIWLLKMNPIANIILTWHSTSNKITEYINIYQIKFDLNDSIIYFLTFIIFTLYIGAIIVDRQDISLQNREVSG